VVVKRKETDVFKIILGSYPNKKIMIEKLKELSVKGFAPVPEIVKKG